MKFYNCFKEKIEMKDMASHEVIESVEALSNQMFSLWDDALDLLVPKA